MTPNGVVERSELNTAVDISRFGESSSRTNDRLELDRSTPKVCRPEYAESTVGIAYSL
jgi:hypothetical protein